MTGKEIESGFRNYVVRPVVIAAILFSFTKIESCSNSQDAQLLNQASELTKGDLKKDGLLNTLLGEIRHLLGHDNKPGTFGSK